MLLKFVSALVTSLLIATPAAAYLDPASSGMVMQILAPVILAVGVAGRRIRDGIVLLWSAATRNAKARQVSDDNTP